MLSLSWITSGFFISSQPSPSLSVSLYKQNGQMDKNELDLSLFLYNPFDKKTVSKLEQYDEFKADFGIDKAKFVSYSILLYDFNSPLRREVPVFSRRKAEAGMLAGFKTDKSGRFDKDVEAMMVGENEACNKAAIKYIFLFGKPEYIELVYLWSIFSFESENSFKIKASGDYQKTIKNIQSLSERIAILTEILYGGAETIEARKALYEYVEKDRLRIRPEDIAEDLEKGEEVGLNPYGDYKPSKLKFTNKPKQ